MIVSRLAYDQVNPETIDAYVIVKEIGTSAAGVANCVHVETDRVCDSFRIYIDPGATVDLTHSLKL